MEFTEVFPELRGVEQSKSNSSTRRWWRLYILAWLMCYTSRGIDGNHICMSIELISEIIMDELCHASSFSISNGKLNINFCMHTSSHSYSLDALQLLPRNREQFLLSAYDLTNDRRIFCYSGVRFSNWFSSITKSFVFFDFICFSISNEMISGKRRSDLNHK